MVRRYATHRACVAPPPNNDISRIALAPPGHGLEQMIVDVQRLDALHQQQRVGPRRRVNSPRGLRTPRARFNDCVRTQSEKCNLANDCNVAGLCLN
jgi:hypothetical protein